MKTMYNKALNIFYELAKIPRKSWHEQKIIQYIQQIADKKNLNYNIDLADNIIVFVPATFWREAEDIIMLQWHMDMVCVKEYWSDHDFLKDPIIVSENDWWLDATGTTLWSDNGIGIAMMLACIELESHPWLELIFTSREEIWLLWASELDASLLRWKILLNLDYEDEGDICIWCAGWARVEFSKKYSLERERGEKCNEIILEISKMKWGHSGVDINLGRWNAIVSMAEFLNWLDIPVRLIAFVWGVAMNAIPSQCNVKLLVKDEEYAYLENAFKNFIQGLWERYDCPDVKGEIKNIEKYSDSYMDISEKSSILHAIIWTNTWVIDYIDEVKEFVSDSKNLWILSIKWGMMNLDYCVRSNNNDSRDQIIESLESTFEEYTCNITGRYPWWQWTKDQTSLQKIKWIYEDEIKAVRGKDLQCTIVNVHAWLECWVVGARLGRPFEAISIGPNIYWAHSPKERCELKSIELIAWVVEKFLS